MAQHDYNIANQSGADFRADLNNALSAIVTVNSGATEPSTTFAHQLWVDTANSVLKIRNAADNAWITTGVSITASNTFTGDLTGNVVGNVTGNLVGNVTGDLTGNADSADTLSTARTISLSGDVVGSASFDGSANIDIDTVVQINSITLGTDTTGDYVESLSGGTGVTVTGGTGEGSTPSIAIGQAVATTDDVTFNIITASEEFIGDLEGGIRFNAKADGALSKGDVVYISGVSGDVPTVGQAKADDASKMPAFGLALSDANDNAALQVVTFGTIEELDTSGVSEGQILYVSTTAGAYTTTAPTGESSQIQNIGKVIRSHASAGSIKVGGAGRSNATPNLDNGKIFIGNGSNQSSTATLDTSIVVENTNLYYTTTRANTDFDTRLATKDTGDLTEGSNLYYTTARVNSDFDTRLATKDTGDLTEGSNLYYTDARVNSAFDTRLATKDTDDVSEGTTNLYYTSARANTDFDTRLATKSTTDLAEGTNLYYTSARFDSAFTSKDTDDLSEGSTNLYYTTARFDSAFGNKTTSDLTENTNLYYTDTRANSAIDARVTKAFVDALGIQASSVDANSVALGTDTTGNYVATITGTANKISVSGSGSESANITLSLPDDVQIASDLTVAGNLTVNGTLTSLDTTNLDIEDNLFQLNAGLTGSPVNDSGMLINRGTADNGIFMWDESVDKFTLGLTTADGSATGNITLNSLGTLVANIEGNVTGAVTGTVSSLSNHDTDDLTEGSNLYYTQARFDSAFTAKSTSDLSEGSNLYYTDARFDTRLATKDTDDVSEGSSNLYYTTARFDSAFSGKSTSDLSEGTNLYYTSARANSDFDTRLATKDTGDLAEGSNLYYTDARAQAVSINNVVEDTTPQLGGDLASNGNDILFADNDKAIFGADSDLKMYHSGTTGTIENYTGTFLISNSSDDYDVIIQSDNGSGGLADYFRADGSAGSAILYNYGNAKLATTSTGIDVTGTVTADGLTVDGDATLSSGSSSNLTLSMYAPDTGYNSSIFLGRTATRKAIIEAEQVDANSGHNLNFYTNANGSDATKRATISKDGDISFYNTAGSSQALYWDASAERLGIGTTSPSQVLHVKDADYTRIQIEAGTTSYGAILNLGDSSDADYGSITQFASAAGEGGRMRFVAGATETMNLRGGNVGIGVSSPQARLHVSGVAPTYTNSSTVFYGGTTNNGVMNGVSLFSSGNALSGGISSNLLIDNGTVSQTNTGRSSGRITFGNTTTSSKTSDIKFGGYVKGSTTLVERMRVDGDGNVLVGGTSAFANDTTTINSSGLVYASRGGNKAGHFNRQTSDGEIVVFSKDGSTVGSISSDSGNTSYNSNGGVIYLGGNQTNHIKVLTSTATGQARIEPSADNAVNLGQSGLRFKDLYLSGKTYLNTNSGAQLVLQTDATRGFVGTSTSHDLILETAGTERMRIDSSGSVCIGTTAPIASAGSERLFVQGSAGADGYISAIQHTGNPNPNRDFIRFYNNAGTDIGAVEHTNTGSVTFSTSSDYRLKENVRPLDKGLERVLKLKAVKYEWKESGETSEGFLAHEVQEAGWYEGVSGKKDDKNMQGMEYGKLTPLLVKAIQEQQTQIEALQSEINLLKGEY